MCVRGRRGTEYEREMTKGPVLRTDPGGFARVPGAGQEVVWQLRTRTTCLEDHPQPDYVEIQYAV